MRIEQLLLKNFRNYESLSILFPSRLTFLLGRNAAGKTNLLEAIGMLSHGKSFRGASDHDLLRYGSNGYYIKAKYSRAGQKGEMEIATDVSTGDLRRKIKFNDKAASSRSSIVGEFICVVFSPSDLQIIEGSPADRRKFLDAAISSMEPEYLQNLIGYQKALRQRNALLKKIRQRQANIADLQIWNARLVQFASQLWSRRENFLLSFKEPFRDALEQISGNRDAMNLELQFSHRDDLKESYGKNVVRDLSLGYTTSGPHRDSLVFLKDGRDIMQFGSQGQKRTAALALRIAQFHHLKQKLKITPLLLIDDVIRELDTMRRSAFVKLLRESGQAIFTTPDLDGIDEDLKSLVSQSSVIHILGDGRVEQSVG